jgi:hypothetical protein
LREGIADNAAEAGEVARLCEGSLDMARQLLDTDVRASRERLYELLSAEPFNQTRLAEQMVSSVDAGGASKLQQRDYTSWLIRFCVEFYRQSLAALAGQESCEIHQAARFANRLGPGSIVACDLIGDLIERCLTAKADLDANVSTPLCIEALCNDLSRTQLDFLRASPATVQTEALAAHPRRSREKT